MLSFWTFPVSADIPPGCSGAAPLPLLSFPCLSFLLGLDYKKKNCASLTFFFLIIWNHLVQVSLVGGRYLIIWAISCQYGISRNWESEAELKLEHRHTVMGSEYPQWASQQRHQILSPQFYFDIQTDLVTCTNECPSAHICSQMWTAVTIAL